MAVASAFATVGESLRPQVSRKREEEICGVGLVVRQPGYMYPCMMIRHIVVQTALSVPVVECSAFCST